MIAMETPLTTWIIIHSILLKPCLIYFAQWTQGSKINFENAKAGRSFISLELLLRLTKAHLYILNCKQEGEISDNEWLIATSKINSIKYISTTVRIN